VNGISFPVIHPAFEKLKHSGRLLHVAAAFILITHAFSHLRESYHPIYFWCLLVFASDILLLVFMSGNLSLTMPGINAVVRLFEVFFFIGIAIFLFLESKWIQCAFHLLLSFLYLYLFYCERKLARPTSECLSIHHSGISIPGLPSDKFLLWTEVNQLEATYHSIKIERATKQQVKFNFRQILKFEELDQIHEFCKHYLGN
jgi:hypothetical protein